MDKTVKVHMLLKADNTSERSVAHLRVKWNISARRRGPTLNAHFNPPSLDWKAIVPVHLKISHRMRIKANISLYTISTLLNLKTPFTNFQTMTHTQLKTDNILKLVV
jgi:hypothetical protein